MRTLLIFEGENLDEVTLSLKNLELWQFESLTELKSVLLYVGITWTSSVRENILAVTMIIRGQMWNNQHATID